MRRDLFTEDHEAFRELARDFIEKEVVPAYPQWEKAGRMPRETFAKLGETGIMGITLPEEYGGGGQDDYRYNVVLHEAPSEPVELPVTVTTDGGELSETADGGFEVSTQSGRTVADAAPPLMWDSAGAESGERPGESGADPSGDAAPEGANVAEVALEINAGAGSNGEVVLSPDQAFLTDPDVVEVLLLSVVVTALWAVIGVAFGSVLPNQVAAIVVILAFTQFVEPIARVALGAFDLTDGIARFLPGAAADGVIGASFFASYGGGSGDLLPRWAALLVLLGYGAALALVGRFTTLRRDVG